MAVAWAVVALLIAGRFAMAFAVPLTGDEAYYWEWSRRLAFGYSDHPPAVAWTAALFSGLGRGAGFVRLGFVLCGAAATLAVGACAGLVSGDRRAGAIAALAFSLAPLSTVALVAATPDAPYLLFWCAALYLAARQERAGGTLGAVLLGLALGGALLSRLFAFALVAGLCAYALGPQGRGLRRNGLWLALAVAALAYAPFVVWNAQHGWETFAFSLVHRHEGESSTGFSFARLLAFAGTQAAAYSPGIWLAATACALRPRSALLAWTALPMLAFLTLFVLVRQVEVNWTLGPFASLCVLIGVAAVRLGPRARTAWLVAAAVPAAALSLVLFAAALFPGQSYALVRRATGQGLRNAGPFEVFAFRPLAHDVAVLAAAPGTVAATDGYGLSSVLDFETGVAPVVIGYDWQGRESHAWYPSSMHPNRLLFVDKEPLATRPDFRAHLTRACTSVADGGQRSYAFAGAPPRTFYFTWCEGLRPDGLAVLRWERESS